MPTGVKISDTEQDERITKAVEAAAGSPIIAALDAEGITLKALAKQLKRELRAKSEHTVKDHEQSTAKKPVYKVIRKPIWDVQQRARIDAHKLRGDYPAEKREILGDVDIVIRDCVKEASDGSGD